MRALRLVFAFVIAPMAFASSARADTLLFSDNFNVTTGAGSTSDANYQYNLAGRQSGSAAPLQYSQTPAPPDAHHQVFPTPTGTLGQPLLLSSDSTTNNTTVSPNANFAQLPSGSSNLIISFDVNPNEPSTSASSSSSFLAFSFGATVQNTLVDSPADHMGLVLRGNGAFRLYNGSSNVTLGGGDLPDATAGGGQFTNVSISITDPDGNPFDGNGAATMTFSSNATGVFAIYSRADFSGNDLTFQSQSAEGKLSSSYIDNLSITAVPEPGEFLLLSAGVALLLKRRRSR